MELNATRWLALLPPTLAPLRRTVENIKDPLYRFFEREVNFGLRLLAAVRLDLEDVAAIIKSGKKQTNHHRALIQMLNKGMIPASWLRYKVPGSCSVAAWVADFGQRVKQLTKVSQAVAGNSAASLKTVTVWMGGLFNPEAFITATRQCVAQANSWSLEELSLDVTVADEADQPSFDDCSFAVEGLKLSGAVCRGNQLAVSSEISTNLHLTRLRWIRNTEGRNTLNEF
jgi:dynein heavy chain 1